MSDNFFLLWLDITLLLLCFAFAGLAAEWLDAHPEAWVTQKLYKIFDFLGN